MRRIVRACAVIAVLTLGGCSLLTGISNKYPTGWAAVQNHADLETALEGAYQNLGDHSFNPLGNRVHPRAPLATVLAGQAIDKGATVTLVTLRRLRPGALEVALSDGNGVRLRATLEAAKGDYRIEDGALWLPTRKMITTESLGHVRESDSLGFRKAADGALICEWRHGSKALAMWIVPMAGSQIFWLRWPAADATTRSSP